MPASGPAKVCQNPWYNDMDNKSNHPRNQIEFDVQSTCRVHVDAQEVHVQVPCDLHDLEQWMLMILRTGSKLALQLATVMSAVGFAAGYCEQQFGP